MVLNWILFITLFILKGSDFGICQTSGSQTIQDYLNQFCLPGTTNSDCNTTNIVTPEPTVPVPLAPPPAPTPAPPSLKCLPGEQQCPQLKTKCVPDEIDCNILDAGISCPVPQPVDDGIRIQVLICGNETPIGVRCGDGDVVPLLTVILVQCPGSNRADPRPVASLNVLDGPGHEGGAGVYRCSEDRSWKPKYQSPTLNELIVSCRNAGCGRLPHPSGRMPVHRRWSWVRGIYKKGKLHCTGTLVSQKALVTAAHCVTRSPVANEADSPFDYSIELPGPSSKTNKVIKVSIDRIQIHPRYNFNDREYQSDVAILFFDLKAHYSLPTVCITDRPHNPNVGKAHVVFNMQQRTGGSSPSWKPYNSGWEFSCHTITTRINTRCIDTLRVQQSQFCASHKGATLSMGSSGGPYLAEVGEDLEEVWVLMGVLSVSSQVSDGTTCFQEHSVFGQVSDDSRWLKDCVFDRRCAF